MEATTKRNIRSGVAYDVLFQKADAVLYTVKKNAVLADTIEFIPTVVAKTLSHTKRIAELLKADHLYDTCKHIWWFVYNHIQYKKDEQGYEQVRSPARTWHDRHKGVDCDCYTVFISSILCNLGIPHILRITRYSGDFQHIYPVVPYQNGKYITIDCVTNHFDYEVPYTGKKDYPMDLQYLSGFDSEPVLRGESNDLDLTGTSDGMDELGKIFRRNRSLLKRRPLPVKAPAAPPMKRPALIPMKKKVAPGFVQRLKAKAASKPTVAPAAFQPSVPAVKKKKKGFKRLISKINKINPTTVLLRNGVLAAMKLNVKNVARRLRWSYLTPLQAAAKGIDAAKFQRLVGVRQKLENIFEMAGGKPSNLQKAILKGKGNRDKAMSGLGETEMDLRGVEELDAYTSLEQLLGPDIYHSENVEGMEGFQGLGELGEPISMASIAAAMGVISGIVASLKKVGDIFKKKSKESADFDETKTDAPENNVPATPSSTKPTLPTTNNPVLPPNAEADTERSDPAPSAAIVPPQRAVRIARTASSPATIVNNSSDSATFSNDNAPDGSAIAPVQQVVPQESRMSSTALHPNAATNSSSTTGKDKNKSFWENNKGWLKPAAIGVGGVGLIVLVAQLTHHRSSQKTSTNSAPLSGIPKARGKKKHYQRKIISTRKKKTAVALM